MNNFGKDFTLGLRTWFNSWSFILRHGLSHFFIYPIAVAVLLFAGAAVLLKRATDALIDSISSYLHFEKLPDESWWQMFKELLSNAAIYAVHFALLLSGWFIYSRISKYVVLALMSPVMSLLSERTDEILTGKKYAFDGQQFVRDVFRGIGLSVRNFFMETFLGLFIWLATVAVTIFSGGLATLLAPLVALLSFGIGAYFYGFSTMDYNNERHRMSMSQSIAYVRQNKGLAVGNGTMFNLLMMIPLIGIAITVVTCTVAATLAMHEKNHNTNE